LDCFFAAALLLRQFPRLVARKGRKVALFCRRNEQKHCKKHPKDTPFQLEINSKDWHELAGWPASNKGAVSEQHWHEKRQQSAANDKLTVHYANSTHNNYIQ